MKIANLQAQNVSQACRFAISLDCLSIMSIMTATVAILQLYCKVHVVKRELPFAFMAHSGPSTGINAFTAWPIRSKTQIDSNSGQKFKAGPSSLRLARPTFSL